MYRMIDGHCVSRIRTYRTVRACNELPQRMEQHREQHALYIYIYMDERVTMDARQINTCVINSSQISLSFQISRG